MRHDHVSGGLFSRFHANVLDALMYFGLNKLPLQIGTEPALAALAFKRYREVNCTRSIGKEGSVGYDFLAGEVLGLEENTVQVGKRARGGGSSFTTVTLAAVPMFFKAFRERVDVHAISHDKDAYRGLGTKPEPASVVDLVTLFDQDLLWAQTGDAAAVPEQSLSVTMALEKKIRCTVPVSKKGYVDLVQGLAREVNVPREKLTD